jgi:SAM-dependent methyltransferase
VQQYDADRYWRDLLSRSFNLQGVGLVGRSITFNRWGYRARQSAVRRILPDAGGARVLDVGSGTGHWISWWHLRGAAEVSGVDLTAVSVEALRREYPGTRFEQADISRSIPIEGPFDLVSAMDVLLHITDDEGYRRAFENLRSVAAPGARLVLLEPVTVGPPRPMAPGAHSRSRSLAELEEALVAGGWKLERWLPSTWLMSNPVEVRPRIVYLALSAWWAGLSVIVRSEVASSILGPLVYGVDQALCRLRWGPSSKVVVARAI